MIKEICFPYFLLDFCKMGSLSSEGWHVQQETVLPGYESAAP